MENEEKNIIPYDDDKIILDSYPYLSIIILSKDRNDLLTQLIMSIIEKTNYEKNKLLIYIADTGSNQKNLEELDNLVSSWQKELNVVLIKYNYYNFAKINNDVVINKIDNKTEYILFCNNDIKLINDAISHMMLLQLRAPKAGTIGCRLHYGDGSIQHLGIWIQYDKNLNKISLGHIGYHKNFSRMAIFQNEHPNGLVSFGNTGGFLLIKKDLFMKYKFNEDYQCCFEDVQLNAALLNDGYYNITSLKGVCYHYAGSTRHDAMTISDYQNMENFIINNCPNIMKQWKEM